MSYVFTYEERNGYIYFDVSGTADNAQDVLEFTERINEEMQRLNSKRLMLDERKLQVHFDQFETYSFAEELVSHLPPLGFRIATVHPEGMRYAYDFIETVLQNRSINYKVFTDQEEAVEWLLA